MARLRYTYQIAAADYSRAVMVLSERSGMMSKADYVQVRDYSEKARGIAEAAREALDRHTAEHACG